MSRREPFRIHDQDGNAVSSSDKQEDHACAVAALARLDVLIAQALQARPPTRSVAIAAVGRDLIPTRVQAQRRVLASVSLICSCGWKGRADQLGDEGCPRCDSDEGLTRGPAGGGQ